MKLSRSRALRGVSAALAVAAVSATSAAWAAPTPELRTPTTTWYDIDDERPYIEDAQASYLDLAGAGVDLTAGWTADAFDGALYDWEVETPTVVEDVTWSAGTQSTAGGRSTWTYTGTTATAGVELAATLDIEGSTARWTITPTVPAPADTTISAFANFGSDGSETVVEVTPTTAIVSSDDNDVDPVIGLAISGTDALIDSVDGDGGAFVEFSADGAATVVVALQDYAPCAEATAISEMTALVPTLIANFGVTIEGALECATVVAPAALTQGTATSQTLAVAIDPAVDVATTDNDGNIVLLSGDGDYLAFPSAVGSAFAGLPAGVTATFDPTTATLSLSGTPTQSGTFEATLVLYRTDLEDYQGDEPVDGAPLTAGFTLTVAAAPAGPGTGGPGTGDTGTGTGGAGAGLGSGTGTGASRSLPDTGAGGLTAGLIGLAMLAAGGTAVIAGRRTRRA
ncbi:LPXTG cell wall anchor domain-containing protein [Aeromicrobium sp. Sec7.5]|uniref:LPXTG cell wall anchor domain-containing protein n=1 Tax=Aeromicrobium sp. Sec7.5 TaxID=3121276 RepID=UPI002FE44D6F